MIVQKANVGDRHEFRKGGGIRSSLRFADHPPGDAAFRANFVGYGEHTGAPGRLPHLTAQQRIHVPSSQVLMSRKPALARYVCSSCGVEDRLVAQYRSPGGIFRCFSKVAHPASEQSEKLSM